ncbi:MAG: maleylpyruvate isomerase family mycothiol-dependent enzyme [Acidimicrobiales bacterium]
MDRSAYLSAIELDGNRMAEAAEGNLGTPVRHCPDWDMAGLLTHMAAVYRFIAAVLAAGPADGPPKVEAEVSPDGDAIVGYFQDKHSAVLDLLRALEQSDPVWTWSPRTDAGFFHRRMAHETAIHRWDAEDAIGVPGALDSDLASDGVDEVIGVGMQFSMRGPLSSWPAGSLHLHRTDGDGEWMLVSDGTSLHVTKEHGKGDAAVRGPAEGLFLYLWGRGRDGLEAFGDEALIDAWANVVP